MVERRAGAPAPAWAPAGSTAPVGATLEARLNLRDVGGHATRNGRPVLTGLLFRSTELSRLDGQDAAALEALGVRTVFDLRTEPERRLQPDRVPPGAEHVVVDVLEGSDEANPAQLMALLSDPRAASAQLGSGGSAALFERKYREFVALDSARAAYGRLFTAIASEAHRPALFHCTTGKDRTGWAAAALLLLLDVPVEVVMADFLRSNDNLVPMFQPALERFAEAGGDPGILIPLIGVQPSYLETALDEMGRRFGTIEGYFAEGLGIDLAAQCCLREAFIERA